MPYLVGQKKSSQPDPAATNQQRDSRRSTTSSTSSAETSRPATQTASNTNYQYQEYDDEPSSEEEEEIEADVEQMLQIFKANDLALQALRERFTNLHSRLNRLENAVDNHNKDRTYCRRHRSKRPTKGK